MKPKSREEHGPGTGNPTLGHSMVSRRTLLAGGFAAAVGAGTARGQETPDPQDDSQPATGRIDHGRIRQSVMGWCFKPMATLELARHCRAIGLEAIEGISADDYPQVRKLGLKISLVGSHGFRQGPVHTDHHAMCIEKLKQGIDLCRAFECSNVITFTGMREPGMRDEVADRNCIECWKQVIDYAEQHDVNLCLEHLNSRDDSHPMKGHPGYYGDDVDHCVDLIRRVDSRRMKLLFDIYHVQVMNGDVIRRIDQYQSLIGHYHTAGNPGRGELDETQEIQYPAIMKAILRTGYQGFVAQEFIPTWDDPVAALRHAALVCDV